MPFILLTFHISFSIFLHCSQTNTVLIYYENVSLQAQCPFSISVLSLGFWQALKMNSLENTKLSQSRSRSATPCTRLICNFSFQFCRCLICSSIWLLRSSTFSVKFLIQIVIHACLTIIPTIITCKQIILQQI